MPKQSYTATLEGQVCVQEMVRYLGLTQEQIADQANLKTRTSVGKLVDGKRVERGAFKRICRCLGLDYTAIAGLTLPSFPTASSTESSSAESQVSGEESKEVLHLICSLKDEVSGMRTDIQTLMDQGARPPQGVTNGEEVPASAVLPQEMFDASSLPTREEVADELIVENSGSAQRLCQPTRKLGSREEAQVTSTTGDRVERQQIYPVIKVSTPSTESNSPLKDFLGKSYDDEHLRATPTPQFQITKPVQSPTLSGSVNPNQRALPAAENSGEVSSPNVGSTEADRSSPSKSPDRDSKKEKRGGLWERLIGR